MRKMSETDTNVITISRSLFGGTSLGKMDCSAVSDLGRKRKTNEDQFIVAELVKNARIQSSSLGHEDRREFRGKSKAQLMLVADGMGGHAAGKTASNVASEHALDYILNNLNWSGDSRSDSKDPEVDERQAQLMDGLSAAVKSCQKAIMDEASWNPKHRGMGTTLTAAVVNWPSLYIAHVGDSRCYLLRDGQLMQLTRDHTFAQAMVDAGEMSKEEAAESRLTHTLWNVVGGHEPTLEPDVFAHELEIGDAILLCSDGLTNHLSDELIAEVISNSTSSHRVCDALVQLANEYGGKDNITAIVARFVDSDDFLTSQESVEELGLSSELPFDADFSLSESTLRHMDDDEAGAK